MSTSPALPSPASRRVPVITAETRTAFQRIAVDQQVVAMRAFCAAIARDAAPTEWSALNAGHRLLMFGGRACGGVVYHPKDGSDVANTVVELCDDRDQAPRVALFVLHEIAHLVQRNLERGMAVEGDAHDRPAWRQACEILSMRAFAVTAVSPALCGRSWPMDVAILATWREPLRELTRTLASVASNYAGPPFPMAAIHEAADRLEALFVGDAETRAPVLLGTLRS